MNVFADYHHEDALDSLYRLFEGRLGMKLYIPGDMNYYERGYVGLNATPSLYYQYFNPVNMGNHIISNRVVHKYPFRHVPFDCFQDIRFDIFLPTHPLNVQGYKKLLMLNNPKAKMVFRAGNNWPNLDWDKFGVHNLLLPSIGTYFQGMTPLFKKFPYEHRMELVGGHHWMEETSMRKFNACFMHSEFNTGLFFPVYERKYPNFMLSLLNVLAEENRDCLLFLCDRLQWELKMFGISNRDGILNDKESEANWIRRAGFFAQLKVADDGYGFNVHRAAYCGCQIITKLSYYRGRFQPDLYASGCLLFNENTFIDADKSMDYVLSELQNRSNNYRQYYDYMVEHARKVLDFDQEEQHIRKFIENLI